MRKNVTTNGDRSNLPMWYTAAAEYSHKKRVANRLSTGIDDVAALDRRIQFYGHGNVLNPKQSAAVTSPRFSRNPLTPPPSRTRSPIYPVRGSVGPTSRFGGALHIQSYSGSSKSSKSPTNAARSSIIAAPSRSTGGLYRSPSRNVTPKRHTLRNPFKSDLVPTKKPSTGIRTRASVPAPLHASKDPLVKCSSKKATSSNKPPLVATHPPDIESDEDNTRVVAVDTKPYQMTSNTVQLIMVEPNKKNQPRVQKIRAAVRKERLSTASDSNQKSKSPRTSENATQQEPVEQQLPTTEQAQQEATATEQEAAAQVLDEPITETTNGAQQVENITVAKSEEEPPLEDMNMECPQAAIQVFQCFTNDCPRLNPAGPDICSLMCESCNNNDNNTNLLSTCSVTEEHFLSFDPGPELQSTADNCWNSLPQYGISHYVYPESEGQQSMDWHTNVQYPHAQTMAQSQPTTRTSLKSCNYGCNRSSCRQQQQEKQPNCFNPQMQQNSRLRMFGQQQQKEQRSPQKQQQQQLEQQQQQQHGLTELLAQQLQQQMQQARAQITQVQMQLYNVCGGSKMSKGDSPTCDECVACTSRQVQTEECNEPWARAEMLLEPCARTTTRCSAQFESPMLPCSRKSNVTFCMAPPSVCQSQCGNSTISPQTEPKVLSFGFSPMFAQAEVREPIALQQQSIFVPQRQFQLPQQQQYQRSNQQQQYPQTPQQVASMLPSQYPGKHFSNPCCRQRYAQMRFIMPRCWQRY